MRVLLDTCVLSELTKPSPERRVQSFISDLSDLDIFTSVICIGEIKKGIELLASSKRKSFLEAWLKKLEIEYNDKVLTIDVDTVKDWARLTANAQKKGKIVSASDGLIAATAICNKLTVVTRNTKDFKYGGVELINPWSN